MTMLQISKSILSWKEVPTWVCAPSKEPTKLTVLSVQLWLLSRLRYLSVRWPPQSGLRSVSPLPARRELDRELGDSRTFQFENFVPTNLRQKAVQEIFEKIVDQWSEVPLNTMPLPEVVGLRECLKAAQMGEDYSYERINYLAREDKAREDPSWINRSEAARLKDLTRRFRLNPEDGILKRVTDLGSVPYIPSHVEVMALSTGPRHSD